MQAAIHEIAELAQHPLYKEAIETWLSNYKELWGETYADFELPPIEMIHGRIRCEFDDIYRHFTEIMEYYGKETVCVIAMNEYQVILLANSKTHDNLRLQEWLRKYEELGMSLITPPINDNNVNNVRTINNTSYVVIGGEFKKTMEFYEVFSHLFWEERLLPESIERIENEGKEYGISEVEFNKQVLSRYPDVICDECKIRGGCKKYPDCGLEDENYFSMACPYDDIIRSHFS